MDQPSPSLPPQTIERAIKLTYAQAMLGSIYAASTGGMFLIGYALRLGASNVQIGLMSTIPMLCVLVQLCSSALVERGISRRRLTIAASLLNVAGWAFIVFIPYMAKGAPAWVRVGALITVLTLVTLFGQIAGNARGSWLGDLVPADFRGTFFGRLTMYGGLIGILFALGEGTFLDLVKGLGVGAFSILFLFGMLFGFLNTALFVPQPDLPTTRHASAGNFLALVRETFANGALVALMIYVMFWSMQGVAGPFYTTYLLRDLHMPFLGIGALNAATMVTLLAFSPFWGRMVNRYGCRPVLIACTAVIVPLPLVWLGLTTPMAVYCVIIPLNLLVGFFVAGISVGINTLVYNITPSAGRSVQLAVYSIVVVLMAAPMPTLGGHLPDWLATLGIHTDLRATFYASIPFVACSAIAACFLKDPGSSHTRELLRKLPGHLRRMAVE